MHYDWHLDIQIDYSIEAALKSLETDKDPENNVIKIGDEQVHILSIPSPTPLPGSKVRRDGEVVALSFVSGSDLKACMFSTSKWFSD